MELNLATIFESLVAAIPDEEAAVCGPTRLTYRQLDARANRLAAAWRRAGIRPGQHVGLLLYNSVEFLEAMLAALKLRAVPVNVNYRYVAQELAYLFDNADLVALVYEAELAHEVEPARTPGLRLLHPVRGVGPGDPYEAVLAAGDPSPAPVPRRGTDRYVVYTGGTTGMPRGVVWHQEDLFYAALQGGAPGGEPYARAEQVAENVMPGCGMSMHPVPPLIHGASQFASWIAWCTGGKVALVPGRSFRAAETCRVLEEEAVTVSQIVGDAMALPIVEELEARPRSLPALTCITSAGAILSRDIRVRLERLVPDALVMNNFGASETGHQGTAWYDSPEAPPRWAMDDRTLVLGPDDAPVAPGSGVVGRLARKGWIPQGYHKDEAKTAATFPTIGGVRYVLPGDMATVDEEGNIVFLGRGAVCINTGGEKVFPEEVEEAIKGHPAVLDAVVVGLPDPRWGERVVAVVQLRADAGDPQRAGLDAWVRARVAGYKAPRAWVQLDTILRHPSGKPDYRWARERAAEVLRAD